LAPNSSNSPLVCRNTPPAAPMSSPMTTTLGSARISSAIASSTASLKVTLRSAMLRSAILRSAMEIVLQAGGRGLGHRARLFGDGGGLGFDALAEFRQRIGSRQLAG